MNANNYNLCAPACYGTGELENGGKSEINVKVLYL